MCMFRIIELNPQQASVKYLCHSVVAPAKRTFMNAAANRTYIALLLINNLADTIGLAPTCLADTKSICAVCPLA
jgi:hypothetical protein